MSDQSTGVATVGNPAPSFTLPGYHDGAVREFTLAEFLEDGALLLSTYPFDFTEVCTDMMCQLGDMNWFQYKTDLSLVALSRDSPFTHEVFAAQEGLDFPLLSDLDAEVIRKYDLVHPEFRGVPHVPKRAVLLVDREGIIRYRWVAEDSSDAWSNNPVEEAIKVLKNL